MGLVQGNLVLQIHCGSRGFGHQICTDYVRDFQAAVRRYNIQLPDRELVCAPLDSPEGQSYLAAMRCAANYAFVNRQVLAHYARRAFEETLAGKVRNWHLHQVYDIAHNMGKVETHEIQGQRVKVCVHRKGATRAFGPGHPDIPAALRSVGQPVLIGGRAQLHAAQVALHVFSRQEALVHDAERTVGRPLHGSDDGYGHVRMYRLHPSPRQPTPAIPQVRLRCPLPTSS